jgi:hypothetical protein
MHRARSGLFLLISLGGAAACDPVASDKYQGEVLATLHGVVTSRTQVPAVVPLEVGLVWGRPDGRGIKFIAEKVPITGSFPAQFTVQLHHPPPAQAGWPLAGGARINMAFIAALSANDWTAGTLLEAGQNIASYGVAGEVLVHLDRDLPAGPNQGVLGLGGVRTAGFHLVGEVDVTAEEAQREAESCRKMFPAAPAAACTPEPGLDGKFRVVREQPEGLGHQIKLALTFPDFIVLSGGDDEEPGPPCVDCGDLIGPGGAPPAGTGPDGGASSGSDGGGAFSGGGGS